MFHSLQQITQHVRLAFTALAISALTALTLFGAASDADAGYTCADNVTHLGNTVTTVLTATSGGSQPYCFSESIIGTDQTSRSVSGSVVNTQVGATNGGYFAYVRAWPQGPGDPFTVNCTQSGQGGACSASDSRTLYGINFTRCTVEGVQSTLPDPALPLVPVVITHTCTISY